MARIKNSFDAEIKLTRCGHEIERRRYGDCPFNDPRGGRAMFAQPFEEHVPADRYANRVNFTVRVFRFDPAQDPIDLIRIARMIRTQQAIGFTAATAKVGYDAAPAELIRLGH